MEKVRLGQTELFVSPAAFGVLTVGKNKLNLSIEEGSELIKYAIEKGINFFDTAQYYRTYPYIREALKDIKDKPIICTKALARSYEDMEAAIQEALDEMELSHIDIFLMHEVRQDPDWDSRKDAWQCLIDYKKKGIVKYIGISTHHIEVVERMVDVEECDIVFPLINYAGLGVRRGSEAGDAAEMAKAIEDCVDAGKGVFAMKAFGGGNLTGDYIKALDYVTSIKGMDVVMVGIGNKEEIDTLISYMEGTLSKDYKPDIANKRIRIYKGNCEGCGACKNRCPNKAIHWSKEDGLAEIDYNICLNCGYCAPVCPTRAILMW